MFRTKIKVIFVLLQCRVFSVEGTGIFLAPLSTVISPLLLFLRIFTQCAFSLSNMAAPTLHECKNSEICIEILMLHLVGASECNIFL